MAETKLNEITVLCDWTDFEALYYALTSTLAPGSIVRCVIDGLHHATDRELELTAQYLEVLVENHDVVALLESAAGIVWIGHHDEVF